MRIVVCMKRVPDTESAIPLAGDGKSVETRDLTYIINPYDEYAIEAALQLKEHSDGKVVLLTVGEVGSESTIRKGLAMGADSAVLLKVERDLTDPLEVAGLLAGWLKDNPADLILCGKQGVDQDHAAVPGMLAQLLGLPGATAICKLEQQADGFLVEREVESGRERVRVTGPCVLSADKGLNEPRFASLKGIMAAKRKSLDVLDAVAQPVGGARVEGLSLPPARPEGRIVGAGAAAAADLLKLLKEEAKVL